MSRLRSLRVFLLAAAALAAITVIAQERGWVFVATSDGSIVFEVPKGYTVAAEDDPEFKKTMEALEKANPQLAQSMTSKPEGQTLVLFDVSDSTDDGYLDNLNVITREIPGMTVELMPQVGEQVLSELPIKGKGEHKIVTLPLGKALNYSAILELNTPDGQKIGMAVVGYMFLKGSKTHIVTFGTHESQIQKKRPIWEKIMKSARVSEGR